MADKFDKIAYNNKYNAEKYDSLRITVPKGKKDKIKAFAAGKGESINSFVNKAIDTVTEKANVTFEDGSAAPDTSSGSADAE
jgi:hypothetical protein